MADGELHCTIKDTEGRTLFAGDASKLQPGELLGASERDFARAAALVVASGKTSTAWLQRQMQIGYNTAAKHIERMEALGIVSAPDSAGRRDVLANDVTVAIKEAIILGAAGGDAAVASLPPDAQPVIAEAVKAGAVKAEFASQPDTLTAETQSRLKSFIERVERLEEDKAGVAGDIKEVFAEAKGEGFDTKIMRRVLRLRRQEVAERDEEQALTELYMSAIGML